MDARQGGLLGNLKPLVEGFGLRALCRRGQADGRVVLAAQLC